MYSLSFSSFSGMSPLAALFVDNSFTMPLTKSSLIGLNEILFAFLIFLFDIFNARMVSRFLHYFFNTVTNGVFVFPGLRPFVWPPALAPKFVFTGPGPKFLFTDPGPQFVFTGPGPQCVLTDPGQK